MARVRPVRTGACLSGIYRKKAFPGLRSRNALFSCGLRTFDPASQHPPKLHHHAADMFILAVIQPAPVVYEAQVDPYPVQCSIRLTQGVDTVLSPEGLGLQQALLKVERCVTEPTCNRMPVDTREALHLWQPSSEIT